MSSSAAAESRRQALFLLAFIMRKTIRADFAAIICLERSLID
jgi:hypothetical protein